MDCYVTFGLSRSAPAGVNSTGLEDFQTFQLQTPLTFDKDISLVLAYRRGITMEFRLTIRGCAKQYYPSNGNVERLSGEMKFALKATLGGENGWKVWH